MYQITVSADSLQASLILFICDIFKGEDVLDGAGNLSFLMDTLVDYFGDEPLELAIYGLEDIENFRPAIEKMRHFVKTFDEAIEIPKEQRISETRKRRQG